MNVFRPLLTAAGTASVGVILAISAPNAVAQGPAVMIDQQCRDQYPDSPELGWGTPYLVAPSDAYSWRCQQVSTLPGGGVIGNLPVDIAAWCAARGLPPAEAINDADPYSWRCGR